MTFSNGLPKAAAVSDPLMAMQRIPVSITCLSGMEVPD
jgi:hypothetical protein